MLFNSPIFLFVFLPLVIAGFYLIGAKSHHRIGLIWLIGASLAFYAYWKAEYLLLILVSIGFNFVFGLLLAPDQIIFHLLELYVCSSFFGQIFYRLPCTLLQAFGC